MINILLARASARFDGPSRRDRARQLLAALFVWCGWAFTWGLLAACDGAGCGAGCGAPALATLVEARGPEVLRDYAASMRVWRPAAVGERFEVGDAIRTGSSATARLLLIDQTQLELAPDTTLRFLVDGDSAGGAIDVEAGEVMLRAGPRDLSLRTHIGRAKVAAGSQVTLTRHSNHIEYQVALGEARFTDSAGAAHVIQAGQSLDIGIGMAVLTAAQPAPVVVQPLPEPQPAAEPDAGAREAPEEEEELAVSGVEPSLEHYNVATRAGESFSVHAAELPTAVRFDFAGKCPNGGVVEIARGKRRARGEQQVSIALNAGSHDYAVRCIKNGRLGRSVARGTVNVMRDAGTRRLPPKAPTSVVEADGRSYAVYYQNQLPDIRVLWPNPPAAASYELDVNGKVMKVAKPEHVFRSGSLRDGIHQLSFAAGNRRSRTTVVDVRFDNAAPKASLTSPTDRGFKAGDTVTIEGVALETWKVSVEGGSVKLDAHQRFVGQVATSAERPDVAVRLSHPRLGVHYYVRRAAASP